MRKTIIDLKKYNYPYQIYHQSWNTSNGTVQFCLLHPTLYSGFNVCRGLIVQNTTTLIRRVGNIKDAKLLISVANGDANLIPKIKDLLNKVEDHLGFSKTVFSEVFFKDNFDFGIDGFTIDNDLIRSRASVLYLKNNSKWFNNTFMLSFYLFLIRRVSRLHSVKDNFKTTFEKYYNKEYKVNSKYFNDHYDFTHIYEFVNIILEHGLEPFFYTQTKSNYLHSNPYNMNEYGMCAVYNKNIQRTDKYKRILDLHKNHSKEEFKEILAKRKDWRIRF